MGAKLTLVGDVMAIADGSNVVNSDTGLLDTQTIWSAGGNWNLGGPYSIGLGLAYLRDF